jgi:hypothetical protein
MRLLLLPAALLVGAAAGVAAVAVHRSPAGLLLAAGAALTAMWALRWWLAHAATLFAVGWLVPLLAALTGRPEGDFAVSADLWGWSLIAAGLAVLVAGVAWGRALPAGGDSGPEGGHT